MTSPFSTNQHFFLAWLEEGVDLNNLEHWKVSQTATSKLKL